MTKSNSGDTYETQLADALAELMKQADRWIRISDSQMIFDGLPGSELSFNNNTIIFQDAQRVSFTEKANGENYTKLSETLNELLAHFRECRCKINLGRINGKFARYFKIGCDRELLPKINIWLREQELAGEWLLFGSGGKIFFDNDNDASLFKLTWVEGKGK